MGLGRTQGLHAALFASHSPLPASFLMLLQRREGRDVATLIRQASMELGLPLGDLRDDVEPDVQWRVARQAMISHFQRSNNKPTHRVRKEDVNTLDDVVNLIQKSSKVRVGVHYPFST